MCVTANLMTSGLDLVLDRLKQLLWVDLVRHEVKMKSDAGGGSNGSLYIHFLYLFLFVLN